MATDAKRGDALQFIFSLFLGVLLVVFIGVGAWTFYEMPDLSDDPAQEKLEDLQREQERIYGKMGGGKVSEPTAADQKRLSVIEEEMEDLNKILEDKRNVWARNTSIILIAFATILMAVSLALPEMMKVFSNGFLLGGMFTLIYGTGWSFASGDSRARFYVVLVALLLSVGFGYLRFIRSRREKAEAAAAAGDTPRNVSGASGGAVSAADSGALAELTSRVAELERRTSAAADALGLRKHD